MNETTPIQVPAPSEPASPGVLEPGTAKPRCLVVSTWQTACGIAHTAETVHSRIKDDFEIEVFALDQYFFRGEETSLHDAAERMMDALCAKAAEVDVVSIQWEPGLLGVNPRLSAKRFARILEAARRVVITVHTVLPIKKFDAFTFARTMSRGPKETARYVYDAFAGRAARQTYETLRRTQAVKPLTLIVHTKRERRFFENVVGIDDVRDHPLSHIPAEWWATLPQARQVNRADLEERFGSDKVFIGFFGFISFYKGIETAIEAMRLLPTNHVLLVYGEVHPSAVQSGIQIDGYLNKVLTSLEPRHETALGKAAGAASKPAGRGAKTKGKSGARDAGSSLDATSSSKSETSSSDDTANQLQGNDAGTRTELARFDSLEERVVFMGSPSNFDFAASIGACDVCVFPYLEVGQSASGPTAMAVELGKPVLVSTSKTFRELRRYMGDRLRFFDIGNYVQLAQMIRHGAKRGDLDTDDLVYDGASMGETYRRALMNEPEAERPLP